MWTSSQAKITRRLCLNGLLITVAMMLSYLEVLIPFELLLPLPGFKLGLANTVTVLTLVLVSKADAALVSAMRILLMGLLFGTPVSLFFSFSGGLLAYLALLLSARFLRRCSHCGVSVLCAAAHNMGQLLAAAWLFGAEIMLSYLPILLTAALLSGSLTGLLLNAAIPRLEKILRPAPHGGNSRP